MDGEIQCRQCRNRTMIFAAAGRCGSRDDRAVEASETTFLELGLGIGLYIMKLCVSTA